MFEYSSEAGKGMNLVGGQVGGLGIPGGGNEEQKPLALWTTK